MQLAFGRKDGTPVMLGSIQEQLDPLAMLRLIKAQFPELWQQVHLEITVAESPKMNGVNRILNAEGNANGNA